ncbi:MAG: T9SS type A sorting domain-containing protein, partial [Cyclobacteriaceae bacterium]|nr:T9SS type A sorting domain-containing protein [Cyclobacteriaceae bacterium HetDA_MAG_MS6]
DNLFINAGFNGTSRGGQLIQYNPLSLAAKALYDGLGVSQNISIYNNWFYYQPGVRYVWADSLMEQPFYDPEMFPFLIDPNGDPMDSATLYEDYTFQGEIELKNAPRLSEAVQRGMIFDQLFAESLDNGSSPNWDFTQSWFFQLIDGNLPEDRSLPYDFSYSSSETAATAAIDGGPVGDRSWELEDFNIVVGTDFRIQNELFYPNPVSSTITFYPQRKIAAVVIFDMKGQRIMRSEVWDSQLDLTDLQKGAYIASLVDSNGNRFNKILLKK